MSNTFTKESFSNWRSTINLFHFLFSPPYCISECGNPAEKWSFPFCASCSASFYRYSITTCHCGAPLQEGAYPCIRCSRELCTPKIPVYSIFPYTGREQRLLKQYKFGGDLRLSRFFARELECFLKKLYYNQRVIMIPIPGNPETIHLRGWDQMKEITQKISQIDGLHTASVLRRRSTGTSLKTLGKENRMAAAVRQYDVKKHSVRQAVSGRVILVDDMFTTGSTIQACCDLLLQRGVHVHSGITLFRDP